VEARRTARAIDGFPAPRQPEMWCGLGVGVAYAGDAGDEILAAGRRPGRSGTACVQARPVRDQVDPLNARTAGLSEHGVLQRVRLVGARSRAGSLSTRLGAADVAAGRETAGRAEGSARERCSLPAQERGERCGSVSINLTINPPFASLGDCISSLIAERCSGLKG
jgi:hypothetical protein